MRPVSPGAAVAGYNSGPGSLDMLFEEGKGNNPLNFFKLMVGMFVV